MNVSRETILAGHPARHNVDKERTLWEWQAEQREHDWLFPTGWQGSATEVTASVDYLRLIGRSKTEATEASSLYASLSSGMLASGFQVENFGMQGYSGERIGSLAYGERQDGSLLQASGGLADFLFRRANLRCGRASRIDLAVTGQLEEGHNEAKHVAKIISVKRDAEDHGRGRPIHLRLQDTFGNGDTLYIGSRNSRAMCRIYHKGLEAPDHYPITTWRWELECKREVAHKLHNDLVVNRSQAPAFASIVSNWLKERGYETPFRASSGVSSPPYVAPPTDNEKSLVWLATQVAPTVERLLDAGLHGEVFKALFQKAPGYVLAQMDDNYFSELAQIVQECYTKACN